MMTDPEVVSEPPTDESSLLPLPAVVDSKGLATPPWRSKSTRTIADSASPEYGRGGVIQEVYGDNDFLGPSMSPGDYFSAALLKTVRVFLDCTYLPQYLPSHRPLWNQYQTSARRIYNQA